MSKLWYKTVVKRNEKSLQYGPTFTKGGHEEHAVYHLRERRFISTWCKHSIKTKYVLFRNMQGPKPYCQRFGGIINIDVIYRTRAIITRGLYTFYTPSEVHLCTVTFGLMYG